MAVVTPRGSVRRAAGALVIGIVAMAAAAAAQGSKTFTTRLSPVPIDVAAQATVSGVGSATATLEGNVLTVTGKFEGLRTPATVARVHSGITRGARGPAIADLSVTASTTGTLTGKVTLTPPQLAALNRGALYIQIHSEKAPDGNLWGWLLAQSQGAAK